MNIRPDIIESVDHARRLREHEALCYVTAAQRTAWYAQGRSAPVYLDPWPLAAIGLERTKSPQATCTALKVFAWTAFITLVDTGVCGRGVTLGLSRSRSGRCRFITSHEPVVENFRKVGRWYFWKVGA